MGHDPNHMSAIRISHTFSRLPGPRSKDEGPHSGQLFRESILKPAFAEARAAGTKVVVDLDGVTFGYPTSFLEEAFGGLARELGIVEVLERLEFISHDEPGLPEEIRTYIREANETSVERNRSRGTTM